MFESVTRQFFLLRNETLRICLLYDSGLFVLCNETLRVALCDETLHNPGIVSGFDGKRLGQ